MWIMGFGKAMTIRISAEMLRGVWEVIKVNMIWNNSKQRPTMSAEQPWLQRKQNESVGLLEEEFYNWGRSSKRKLD